MRSPATGMQGDHRKLTYPPLFDRYAFSVRALEFLLPRNNKSLSISIKFTAQLSRGLKKLGTLLDLRVSSLRRGHANLLCIVLILSDDPRRKSLEGPDRPAHRVEKDTTNAAWPGGVAGLIRRICEHV